MLPAVLGHPATVLTAAADVEDQKGMSSKGASFFGNVGSRQYPHAGNGRLCEPWFPGLLLVGDQTGVHSIFFWLMLASLQSFLVASHPSSSRVNGTLLKFAQPQC